MFETPHRYIDLPHARIATWTCGSGPDLVFIHGWPLWSATFRRLLPTLQQRFTCHLIDLPGAGKTEVRDWASIDLRRHVDTVAATVDALGLERYALLAFDSGGMVTRTLAAERPEQVTGLVLGNTEMPGFVSPLFSRFAQKAATRLGQAVMTAALAIPALRRSRYGYGSTFLNPSFIDGEFTRLFIRPMLWSRDVRARQFALLEDFDPTFVDDMQAIHQAIQCPTLLIWGDRDPWFPLAGAQACRAQFGGGAELEVLPGKLFVHEEQSARFAALSAAFLERALARAA